MSLAGDRRNGSDMPTQAKARAANVGKAYQLIPVVGPSAGIDLRSAPTLIAADRARMLVNWSLKEPGALVVHAGFQAFSSALSAAGPFSGGARIYLNTSIPTPDSTIFTLVAFNGGVYEVNDAGVLNSTALLTGLSTGQIDFVSDRNVVAAFDGLSTAIFKSTNGSSWTRFGIASGTVSSTLSSKAGGSLSTSEFEFTYTYKDRDQAYESNESSVLSTITIGSTANGSVELQIPNSTDVQVDAVVVYARNKTNSETIRRKASSGPVQAGAHSTITVTSSAWLSNDEAPTDHGLAPVLSFGRVWKNRWWARSATVTNRLHFTQLFQPQAWPPLFYIDIPFERGDAIQAIYPIGDTLLIFGTTRIFVIIGQTSLDFEVRPTLASEDGALGFRAVWAIENGVVHAAASGVYIFDGTTDKLLSYDLDPGWRDLVANTSGAALAKVAVVYHQREKECRVAVPRRYPSGATGEWILDLNRTRTTQVPAWTASDRTIAGYILWDGPESQAGNQGRLVSWHSSVAQLFDESLGTSANSSNLTAEYEGPGLTLGAQRGRWIDIRTEYEPHSGSFGIEPLVDGVTFGSQAVTIAGGGAEYGTAQYGIDDYGGGVSRKQAYTMLPLEADGRSLVLKLVYIGQEAFRVYSYHLGLVPETRSRSFSE